MEPLAVDLLLLRGFKGAELRLTPGRALMARVVSADAGGRGTLSIAGALVEAELPKSVRAGQELRLEIRSVGPERVELAVATPADPPVPPAVPLPGGGSVTVVAKDGSAAGTGSPTQTVTLRYDAPHLGPVDLAFVLDAASLRVTVTAPAGDAHATTTAQARALEDALRAATQRPVSVAVRPRRDPLDVYA